MADWLYQLEIKTLLNGNDGNVDQAAKAAAPEVASRIRQLMTIVESETRPKAVAIIDGLWEQLDEVACEFERINAPDNVPAGSPTETFNEALELLYSISDNRHVIWVK